MKSIRNFCVCLSILFAPLSGLRAADLELSRPEKVAFDMLSATDQEKVLSGDAKFFGGMELGIGKRIAYLRLPVHVQELMRKDQLKRDAAALGVYLKNPATSSIKLSSLNHSGNFNPSHRHDCDDDRTSCAPNCTWRSSDGSCNSYGQDYCGPNASCAMKCTWRSSDGSCNSYDNDFCGSNAYCSENCTWRSSDGSCNSYGADVCYRD